MLYMTIVVFLMFERLPFPRVLKPCASIAVFLGYHPCCYHKIDKTLKSHSSLKFFTLRVARHWNRLPRVSVDVPSLEVLKAGSDGALSNLVWGKGLEPHPLVVPSNPNHSRILF